MTGYERVGFSERGKEGIFNLHCILHSGKNFSFMGRPLAGSNVFTGRKFCPF